METNVMDKGRNIQIGPFGGIVRGDPTWKMRMNGTTSYASGSQKRNCWKEKSSLGSRTFSACGEIFLRVLGTLYPCTKYTMQCNDFYH